MDIVNPYLLLIYYMTDNVTEASSSICTAVQIKKLTINCHALSQSQGSNFLSYLPNKEA